MCFKKDPDAKSVLDDASNYVATFRSSLSDEIDALVNTQTDDAFMHFRRQLLRELQKQQSERDWEFDGGGQRRLFLTALAEMLVVGDVVSLDVFRKRCYSEPWLRTDALRIDAIKKHPAPHLIPDTTEKEETNMPTYTENNNMNLNEVAIEKRTFIFGVPAENLTKQRLYDLIIELENKISGLSVVKNKPKSLKRDIKELESQIEAIVEFTDTKFAAKE